jgi:CBS-domain-containing membrane protein
LSYGDAMTANLEDRSGSIARPSQLFDALLAVGLAAFLVVGTYFASQGQHHRRPFDAGTVALLVVAAGALAWRRRYPVPVLGVVFGAALVYFVLGYWHSPTNRRFPRRRVKRITVRPTTDGRARRYTDFPVDPADGRHKLRIEVTMEQPDDWGGLFLRDYIIRAGPTTSADS